jgi:predicted unusual protein kinase regulating ubiquinone biosynthesis (AarF/ABC1/UbiB family)
VYEWEVRRWLVVLASIATVAALWRAPLVRRLLRRYAQLGAAVGRTGARRTALAARTVTASDERRAALEADFQLRSAEDVARTLGSMKGAFMKVGQLASFVDDGLPEPVRAALAQLQDAAPPMSPDLVASVIRSELGADPAKVFRQWDPVPVAAASIGQVHRAVLDDGTCVAVKVQYPDIDKVVAADLAQLDLGRLFIPTLYPDMDARAVTGELRDRLTEELDYRIEADNQRDFASWYRDHPFIHVPSVVDELSTGRVLTAGYVDGARFAEAERWDQPARDRAGEIIYRFVLRSIAAHAAFNGDPHPGNYLFGGGGVTFLDFGLVKRLSAQSRDDTIASVALATIEPDPPALAELCERMGYFTPGNPLSPDLILEFSALLWGHTAEDRPFTITASWASDVVRTFLLKGDRFRALDKYGGLPVDSIILQRITVGVLAVLGRLNATANWHRITRELWLGDDPATALGETERQWRADRRA